ncbi:hypothetical protein GTZ85_10950 [Streptomyces sp. SID5474]|nr:hypothetical protein [Streptomyces sp. SID5474]
MGQPLAGQAVVVTGTVTGVLAELSRSEMNGPTERPGGRAASGVSAKTTLVVARHKAESKRAKAESLNIPILTMSGSDSRRARTGILRTASEPAADTSRSDSPPRFQPTRWRARYDAGDTPPSAGSPRG